MDRWGRRGRTMFALFVCALKLPTLVIPALKVGGFGSKRVPIFSQVSLLLEAVFSCNSGSQCDDLCAKSYVTSASSIVTHSQNRHLCKPSVAS